MIFSSLNNENPAIKVLCQDSSEMHPTADLRKGDEYGGTYSCVKGHKEISQSGTVQFCASGVFGHRRLFLSAWAYNLFRKEAYICSTN